MRSKPARRACKTPGIGTENPGTAGLACGPGPRKYARRSVCRHEVVPIRVNLDAAGFVDTPPSATLLGDDLNTPRPAERTLPIGPMAGPAGVVALSLHLVADATVTGAACDIDGGSALV